MGVWILYDRKNERAVLFCSTSEWAFGPAFHDSEARGDEFNAEGVAESFLRWVRPVDPRGLTDSELEAKVEEWRALHDAGALDPEPEPDDDYTADDDAALDKALGGGE